MFRWGVHFATLFVGILILGVSQDAATSGYYGLIGALHAAALLISIVNRLGISRTILFVVVASVLSAVTQWTAFGFAWAMLPMLPMPRPLETLALFATLALSSAFGAAGYWFAIRSILWKSLAWRDLAPALVLCMIATCGAFWMAGSAFAFSSFPQQRGLLPTLAWWIAFSLSLCWSDRRQRLVLSSLQGPSSSFPPPAPQAEHVAIRASNPVDL